MEKSATRTGKPAARRRTYKLLGLALILLSLALALPAVASAFVSTGDGTWVWQNPLPQGNTLNDVIFLDASHGWSVGVYGTLMATSDGGVSWIGQRSGTTQDLNGVMFSDASHGWVVGNNGTILATVDGGAHWSAQSSGTTCLLYTSPSPRD